MAQNQFNRKAKQEYFGAAPNVFVGRYGYPRVNVGILNTEHDQFGEHDNTPLWAKENYKIPQIMDLRLQLINSRFKANIKSFDEKFMDMTQEVSMASKPVDIELALNKKPHFNINFNQDVKPHGTNVKLEKARITENPKIHTKVDKIVSDTDLKAAQGLSKLYKKDFDGYFLTKLFSVGNLGIGKNRKLVPTRWSITAVDDTLGKSLLNDVRDYKQTNYLAFFSSYLGNYYVVLMFPEIWQYELFETYAGALGGVKDDMMTRKWMTDYEPFGGRKKYVEQTAGGYYAAKLPVLEYLKQKKRQASVLVLRFITTDYYAHLGVWVCREAVRKAMQNNPIEFASKDLMLEYVRKLAKKKFGYNVNPILHNSKVLDNLGKQSKLAAFF